MKSRVIGAFLVLSATAGASPIVYATLDASLETGSLAGTNFTVSISYDAAQLQAAGPSYITLDTFDFVLLGTPFNRSEIFQGGQVILFNGVIQNVTASYQVTLPPKAPVENITFGFGGDGVIGYIDLNGQFGTGSFVVVPEPCISLMIGAGSIGMWIRRPKPPDPRRCPTGR